MAKYKFIAIKSVPTKAASKPIAEIGPWFLSFCGSNRFYENTDKKLENCDEF